MKRAFLLVLTLAAAGAYAQDFDATETPSYDFSDNVPGIGQVDHTFSYNCISGWSCVWGFNLATPASGGANFWRFHKIWSDDALVDGDGFTYQEGSSASRWLSNTPAYLKGKIKTYVEVVTPAESGNPVRLIVHYEFPDGTNLARPHAFRAETD